MNIKLVKVFAILLLPLMALAGEEKPDTVSFTADVIQTIGDTSTDDELFVKGYKYLIETTIEGENTSIIVNQMSDKVKILLHSKEIAKEIPDTSSELLDIDPFSSYKDLLGKYPSREKGSKDINGYKCLEIEIYEKDKILMTAWVAKKLNWPIKIKSNLDPPKKVKLENIMEKPVGECVFQIPSEYKFLSSQETKKAESEVKEKPKK